MMPGIRLTIGFRWSIDKESPRDTDRNSRQSGPGVEFSGMRREGRPGEVRRRTVGMGGIVRFLLGGALGALLGFFLSERRGRRRDTLSEPAGVGPSPEKAAQAVVVPVSPLTGLVRDPQPIPEQAPAVGLEVAGTEAAPGLDEEEDDTGIELAKIAAAASLVRPVGPTEESPTEWPVLSDEMPVTEVSAAETGTEEFSIDSLLQEDWATVEGWPVAPADAALVDEETPAAPDETEPAVQLEKEPVGPERAFLDESRRSLITADELRTRIEESRRRIRLELEQPFLRETAPRDDSAPTYPSMKATPASTAPADREALSDGEDLRSRMEAARQVSEEGPRPTPSELETSLSYDAMRARIEETRNRLKARAGEVRLRSEIGYSETEPDSEPARAPQTTPDLEGSRAEESESDADVVARIERLLSERPDDN